MSWRTVLTYALTVAVSVLALSPASICAMPISEMAVSCHGEAPSSAGNHHSPAHAVHGHASVGNDAHGAGHAEQVPHDETLCMVDVAAPSLSVHVGIDLPVPAAGQPLQVLPVALDSVASPVAALHAEWPPSFRPPPASIAILRI